MLTGAGLGDHARFAHPFGQQRLADHIVDLVSTSMVQIFALEVDLRAAHLFGPAFSMINWTGTSDEMFELVVEFGEKFRILAVVRIRVF